MMKGTRLLAGLIALCWAGAALASEPAAPLFADDAPIHITIKGPFARLMSNRNETTILPATLSVDGATPETLPITLAPRGITRRAKDICQFPPLRVEFSQTPGAGSLFAGQHKLKLVTHCRSNPAFQQYLLLEYSAYRMYNLLTPFSFRARLASVDYVDVSGKPVVSRFGFFLEDPKGIAQRNGVEQARVGTTVPSTALSAPEATRAAVFEYMIGNLDFAFTAGPAGTPCCHNARLLLAPGPTMKFVVVPYDFDFSGMVDAPYATPPEAIPLANVRVRRFRGYCRNNAAVPGAIAELSAQRAAMVGVFNSIPQLEPDTKAKASKYLAGFFAATASPAEVESNLLKTCI